MKKALIKRLARLAVFFAGLLVLIDIANCYLVQTDTFAYLTMKDIRERDDIEIALVGSSIVQHHLNPDIITEVTGKTSFDAAMTNMMLSGSLPMTRELFAYHNPEYTVLVVESYTFNSVKEDMQTQHKMAPLLSSPINRLRYWLDTSSNDGRWADRFFLFRSFAYRNWDDFVKTMRLRFDTDDYVAEIRQTWGGGTDYKDGFVRRNEARRPDELVRTTFEREEFGYTYELLDFSKEKLLQYKALCEKEGTKLVVAFLPTLTVHALAEESFLPYIESATAYLDEIGVPYINLQYAKPELLPNLDHLYFDLYHLIGEGADILSEAFAKALKAHIDGEDISDLFYADSREYLASIDFITNTWVKLESTGEDGSLSFRADCNRGTLVTAEYQFVLAHEDGSETLLRDFDRGDHYVCTPEAIEGGTLRVYARVLNGDGKTVWNEYVPETGEAEQ